MKHLLALTVLLLLGCGPPPPTLSSDLWGCWGLSSAGYFAVGDLGAIRKWDGNRSWPLVPNESGDLLLAIWGSDANNIWAVGRPGTILKWNGVSWSSQSSSTKNHLYGVWGTSSTDVWAVGYFGTIL